MMTYGWGPGGVGAWAVLVAWIVLLVVVGLVAWTVAPGREAPGGAGVAQRGTVLVAVAGLALVVTAAWAFSGIGGGWMHQDGVAGYGGGMVGEPGGTIDGIHGLRGTGPVATLSQARTAAQPYADRLGLEVGEVMQFDNGFYAELIGADGAGATEVLIDAEDGDVRVEYGPAMMWNTAYGMHAAGTAVPAQVSADRARELADEWLAERGDDPDVGVGAAEAFPGYYTLHTERDGKVAGMLSVNAYTGAVWFHSWHGSFIAMTEH